MIAYQILMILKSLPKSNGQMYKTLKGYGRKVMSLNFNAWRFASLFQSILAKNTVFIKSV